MELLLATVACFVAVAASDSNEVLRRGNGEFTVYWNSPTFQCLSHSIDFTSTLSKFGIVNNAGDSFRGDRLAIMYDPGLFPALLERSDQRGYFFRNGGLPQSGNLSEHLEMFEKSVREQIPDDGFNGVGIIDFESWRPIFRQNFGTLLPYKEISRDLEQQAHPHWSSAQVEAEATRRFEKSGRVFVEQTLRRAKQLRPAARWGYYAYPYCFNMNGNKRAECGDEVSAENDRISWLWTLADNYYPSLYMGKTTLTAVQKKQMIQGRIDEAQRLQRESGNPFGKHILPYFWYRYRDVEQFLNKEDLLNSFTTLKNSGIDGMILWGSSNDVNSKAKCEALRKYVENTLGPLLLST